MDFKRRDVVGIIILLSIIGLMVGWRWHKISRQDKLTFEEPGIDLEEAVEKQREIKVHVTGAVQTPGVYTLKEGARALDALLAAGGPLAGADEHAFNLAQPLYDGQRIEIPFKRKEGEGQGQGGSHGSQLININTAPAVLLETLPNIGPARAAQIIQHREQYGFFGSVDELAKVPGIGEKTLAALRDLVTIY
jgi:competence protein ComEA